MSTSKLFSKANYLNKTIQYLRDVNIREYDIQDAGFSLIKFHNLLSEDEIKRLENLPKVFRHKEIGIMRGSRKGFSKDLSDAMRVAVELFLVENEIETSELLAIKNDAVFIVSNKHIKKTKHHGATFVNKESYTSYLYINGVEYYYNSFLDKMDIKGLNKKVVATHSSCLLNFIKNILHYNEIMVDTDDVIESLAEFRSDYIELKLEKNFYRHLSHDNGFTLKSLRGQRTQYVLSSISDSDKSDLDITYNYMHIILPIISIFI
jgi:hypothetical protein